MPGTVVGSSGAVSLQNLRTILDTVKEVQGIFIWSFYPLFPSPMSVRKETSGLCPVLERIMNVSSHLWPCHWRHNHLGYFNKSLDWPEDIIAHTLFPDAVTACRLCRKLSLLTVSSATVAVIKLGLRNCWLALACSRGSWTTAHLSLCVTVVQVGIFQGTFSSLWIGI